MCVLVSPELHSPARLTDSRGTTYEDRRTPGANSIIIITIIIIIPKPAYVQLRSYINYFLTCRSMQNYVQILITLSAPRFSNRLLPTHYNYVIFSRSNYVNLIYSAEGEYTVTTRYTETVKRYHQIFYFSSYAKSISNHQTMSNTRTSAFYPRLTVTHLTSYLLTTISHSYDFVVPLVPKRLYKLLDHLDLDSEFYCYQAFS